VRLFSGGDGDPHHLMFLHHRRRVHSPASPGNGIVENRPAKENTMTSFRDGAIALTVTGLLCVLGTSAAAATTPAQKCEGGKNDAAGKYASCVAKAEKNLVTSGDTGKYSTALGKCDEKFSDSWNKLESSAEGACPSDGDAVPVRSFVDACVQSVAEAVSPGGSLPVDVATCNTNLATCGTTLGTGNTTLATSTTDLATGETDLDDCDADVAALEAEMRCPAGGIAGLYTTSLPSLPATCATALSFSGSTVVSSITSCSNGTPDGNLTGTVTGNVIALAEEPSAACGFGLRGEVSLVIDNDCESSSGTFVCRAGPGGIIYSNVPVVVTRN
jgi:hypothetical protein